MKELTNELSKVLKIQKIKCFEKGPFLTKNITLFCFDFYRISFSIIIF